MKPIEDNGLANVVALDPGGTTGWSVMSIYPDALVVDDISILLSMVHWRQGQIVGSESVQQDSILELLAMWPGAAVVTETFRARHAMMSEESMSPYRLNVIIKWALRKGYDGLDEFGDPPRQMFTQQPSLAMGTATDQRLKEWGLYHADGQEHARDATRHAVTFLRRAKDKSNLRYRAWGHLYDSKGELIQTEE